MAEDLYPSDFETAYRAGQIDKATRDRGIKNLQMQTDYLPIRYGQTWWHMMEETVDTIVENSMTKNIASASMWNTLALLGALYAPVSAAAKELARPVDGFLIDMGASPGFAKTARGLGEFALNLIPLERAAAAAGGVKKLLEPGRVAEIPKIIQQATEEGTKAIKVIKGLSPRAQARVAREAQSARIEAEALFDNLISTNGQQAVRVAASQSDELQRIMAEGERAQAGKGAAVLNEQKLQAYREEEALLTPLIKSADEQANAILARDKAIRESIAQQEMTRAIQGEGQPLVETGIADAQAQARNLQNMRDQLSSYLAKRKAQAETSATLEAAGEAVRGKSPTETSKLLDAAQQTFLGRAVPQDTLKQLEGMRQRLVDKGCL